MYQSRSRFVFIITILAIVVSKVNCQTTIPDILIKKSLKEQLTYIEERTKIFENYRAIREDMFQKLTENITDTLTIAKNTIAVLDNKTITLKQTIDSLNTSLKTTQNSLDEITRTKNTIRLFGHEFNKVTYNILMWAILLVLIWILVIGFLSYKRNQSITNNARKEFLELKNEFEAYRKTTREAREKMAMDHYKEIKKLKGI
jgi:hypothetical protein